MTIIAQVVHGKFLPKTNTPVSEGSLEMIELEKPYDGRTIGILPAQAQGRGNLDKRLGRHFKPGDRVIIKRFTLEKSAIRVLEIA